jgi:muramoyltetrapeptide carboxypeptidase
MPRLKSIGIIAPAASLRDEELVFVEEGIAYLESLGLKVFKANNLYDRDLLCEGSDSYLCGNVEVRLSSMMSLWSDSQVDALLSLRGGYGCIQLLESLDYDYCARNPKPVLGYSDLTALFSALYTQAYKARLALYHTPMLAELSRLIPSEKNSFEDLLTSIDPDAYKAYELPSRDEKILGGNLSVLNSLLGTKYIYDFKDSILFIEDCNEPAYKIDRMLYQLKLAGVFSQVRRVIIGESLEAIFPTSALDLVGVPYQSGASCGHKSKHSLVLG